MKKEMKVHFIYALIFLVILSSFFFYENYQTQTTRQLVQTEVTKISSQIQQLQQQDQVITNSLNQLDENIQQRESEIQTLTGELKQFRVESQQQVTQLQDKVASLKAQNQDFSDVIERAIPAVISIRTDISSGSGFLISQEGYAVTNYHVIEGASAGIAVTSDGQRHRVRIVGFNKNADVAVLQLDEQDFPFLQFGNSQATTIGESVIAVGNPGGLDFTVTKGIVSAKREDSFNNQLIQIDVPINPGNSGGPLINAAGRVIGVNTKKILNFEGVGFALESNFVEEIVDDIIDEDQAIQIQQTNS